MKRIDLVQFEEKLRSAMFGHVDRDKAIKGDDLAAKIGVSRASLTGLLPKVRSKIPGLTSGRAGYWIAPADGEKSGQRDGNPAPQARRPALRVTGFDLEDLFTERFPRSPHVRVFGERPGHPSTVISFVVPNKRRPDREWRVRMVSYPGETLCHFWFAVEIVAKQLFEGRGQPA